MPFFLLLGDDSSLESPVAPSGSYFPPTTPTPEGFSDFFQKEIFPDFFPHSTNIDSRTNSIVFPRITRTPTSSSTTGSESIARSAKSNASIASSSSFTSTPSGAVVPRPPRQVQKKQKITSLGDRRGYGLSIDLAGSDKIFGNHSGRDVRF